MKIITAIYVYRFHLVVSYLNHGLTIIPFKDKRENYYGKVRFASQFEFNGELVELNANRNTLYGMSGSSIYSGSLNPHGEQKIEKIYSSDLEGKEFSQLSIDHDKNNLFAFAMNDGLYQLSLSSPNRPKVLEKIIPKDFDKLGSPIISNLISLKEHLFVSIRNYGTAQLRSSPSGYKSKRTIESADPQDVTFLPSSGIVGIADTEDGVLLFKENSIKPFKKISLPNNDFPQQIGKMHNSIIVKGKLGLYAYNITTNKFSVIKEGKVGTFDTFYEYIFFSSQGKVYVQNMNNNFSQQFFSANDANDFEIIRSPF